MRSWQSNNSSGVKGVYYDKTTGKYRPYIGFKGKQHKLGSYNTLEEAKRVREAAEVEFHQPFLESLEKAGKSQ